MKNLMLAYYGDDFTGSTDALEFISRAGMKAVLFIDPPTKEQLSRCADLDAIGIAGKTRSLSPTEMELELQPAFECLKNLQPRHVHYKVCSTFDSSPAVGSIGKAIDIGSSVFHTSLIPLLVAAPVLGRYSVFGNLFARMGIGSSGDVFRLDRHPSMSNHPVTPSDESDIRLHLGKQTKKTTGLLDILKLQEGKESCSHAFGQFKQDGIHILLFDALYQDQLTLIGELIDDEAMAGSTLFSVGSSGVEMALGAYWNSTATFQKINSWKLPAYASPLLVLSGSCSPVTSAQVKWAIEHEFKEIKIDSVSISNEGGPDLLESYCNQAVESLQSNNSVIIHTGGMNRKTLQQKDSARVLGSYLGLLGRAICKRTKIARLVIAGGDTSSYAARALGIEAVEMIAPLVPGAPLCKAYAPGSPLDNMEVNFKGGQVGGEDYFGVMKQGYLNMTF